MAREGVVPAMIDEPGEEDLLGKLIKRAEAFRQSLIDASTKGSLKKKKSTSASTSVDTVDEELASATDLDGLLSEEDGQAEQRSSANLEDLLDTLLLSGEDDEACTSELEVSDSDKAAALEQHRMDEAALLEELFFGGQQGNLSEPRTTPSQTKKPADELVQVAEEGLQLLVTVDTLVLSDMAVKDLTQLRPSRLGHPGRKTSVLPSCTCLLTLFFPAVLGVDGSKLCPEQRISITPAKTERRVLHFGYKSQLFWKLPNVKAREEWWKQLVKTTVYLRWQSGESLECYGYMALKSALGTASAGFPTSLVLVGAKSSQDGRLEPDRNRRAASSSLHETEGRPVATLEIGMAVVVEPAEVQPKQQEQRQEQQLHQQQPTKEEQGPWVYLDLQELSGFVSELESEPGKQPTWRRLLVIKSGSTTTFRSIGRKPGQKYVDSVLRPTTEAEGLVFLEIWSSWRSYQVLSGGGGLEDLVAIVRVPYSLDTWRGRKARQGTVRFSGKFKAWHPRKSPIKSKVPVSVVLGHRYQILRLQAENQAATVIQQFVRKFLRRLRQPCDVDADLNDVVSWHTFRVIVQKLTGLPDRPQPPGKVFIKYLFPGEKEALYTQESEWLETVVFEASAQHRISLSKDTNIVSYVTGVLDRKREGLRFEIWQTGSSGEQRLGASYLWQASLLRLLDSHNRARKVFRLGINDHTAALLHAELFVEVGYQRLDFSNRLLEGTIFADHLSCPAVPLEATLDMRIVRAKGLQDLAASWPKGLNSYVRLSLFPSNQSLGALCPPQYTPFRMNSVTPFYGWSSTLVIILTVDVVQELRRSNMSLELWHHSVRDHKSRGSLMSLKSLDADVWLATAPAPCSALLTNRRGVSGWLKLLSRRREAVGKIEVEIKFVSWKWLS